MRLLGCTLLVPVSRSRLSLRLWKLEMPVLTPLRLHSLRVHKELEILFNYLIVSIRRDDIASICITIILRDEFSAHLRRPELSDSWCCPTELLLNLAWMEQRSQLLWCIRAI